MQEITLIRGTRGDPVLDIAVSHALLRRVAAAQLPATARVYRPQATVAFGKLDALRPGYARAADEALAHGFAPVLRIAGGHAAAYDEGAVIVELVTPSVRVAEGIAERFEAGSRMLQAALGAVGVHPQVGELPGEYCPGAWSVHAGGVKLAGPAQRSIRGAALWSAFVAVEGGDRLRAVLTDVYAALGLEWRPQTAGALEDVVAGVTADAVDAALAAAVGGDEGELDGETLALARRLAQAASATTPGTR